MAAGGGRGIDGTLNPNFFVPSGLDVLSPIDPQGPQGGVDMMGTNGLASRTAALRINTTVSPGGRPSSEELSATTSVSGSEWSSEVGDSERGQREVWSGELSSVIGLQKRGLRGLMEGRRMRERTGTGTMNSGPAMSGRVGLGIASGS